MRFANPWILHLLWFLTLVALVYFWDERLRKIVLRRWGTHAVLERLCPSVSLRKRRFRKLLELAAFFLIMLALARPLLGKGEAPMKRRGLDIVIAVDTSLSMMAEDFPPNRLAKAVQELSDLLGELRGNRLALVAFAGFPVTLSPLTLDANALKIYLDLLDAQLIGEQGTAIGDAIRHCLSLFDKGKSHAKVIVLLTDGEDQGTDPVDAAREARSQGVRIYPIGIGENSGEPIPVLDEALRRVGHKRTEQGEVVLTRLDEATLRQIARITGGEYHRASLGQIEVEKIFRRMEALEKGELGEASLVQYHEQFQIPLLAAFMILFLAEWMGEKKGKAIFAFWGGKPLFIFWLFTLPCLMGFSSSKLNDQGNEAYREGKYDEAIKRYEEALKRRAQGALHFNLGNSYFQKQKMEDAQAHYEKALDSHEKRLAGRSFYGLGNCAFRSGRYQEALSFYKRAIEEDAQDVDAKYNYEVTLRKLSELEKQKQDEKKAQEKEEKQEKKERQEKQAGQGMEQKENASQKKAMEKEGKDESGQARLGEEKKEDAASEMKGGEGENKGVTQGRSEKKEGMSEEEALRILEAVSRERKDLLWNATRQAGSSERREGKDW